ncbi:GNAT family N-acetyltransferase [Pedobacter gandavensis]|uniref:GNAT family N-acetyltransferase n=1 Tax=Pedobacter gandavensis TaxID=2679963 RepID=A0ABR6EU97_9SPHI|nr:GNAT family protein [Pedobacter gandavensis]MBB2148847.1 GNAT family N-acetyltransferase [Pedobacter gandavensis]
MLYIFDPETDYILEDEHVLLRPLEISDFDHLKTFAINEPELWTYSSQNAGSERGMKEVIEKALIAKENGLAYPFIVFDKIKQQYAGVTRLYDIDLSNKCLSIGHTWYGREFQGTGLNKHCKYLLFEFVFEQMGMERVEFRLDARNERSMRAIKGLGCTFEGVLRSNGYRVDGGRRDSAVLSMLKDEWFNGKKELLKDKLI